MQRTNILRDLDEDAAAGSSYVAQDTVARLGAPIPGRREALVRDQIARAEALFEQGMAGVAELRRGRRAVAAAGAMYREILREIERGGYGAVPGRAVVSGPQKLAVGLRAALSA
jgi:phytoene synthase